MEKKQILFIGWTPQEFDLLAIDVKKQKNFEVHSRLYPADAIDMIKRSADINPIVGLVFNSTMEDRKCSTTIEFAKDAIRSKGNLVVIYMGRSPEVKAPVNHHFVQTGDWKKVMEILINSKNK